MEKSSWVEVVGGFVRAARGEALVGVMLLSLFVVVVVVVVIVVVGWNPFLLKLWADLYN